MRALAVVLIVGLTSGVDAWFGAAPLLGRAIATQSAQPLRSGVDVVEVAALVRDREGRLLSDLAASDFQILENGTPQTIAAFQRVSMPARTAASAAAASAVLGNDVASNERASDARVFITTLDVDVPSFEPDNLTMSGVTLTSLPSVLMFTRGDEWLQPALGTPPSAARSFISGDQITAAVEVYVPAQRPADVAVSAQVERPDGSRVVAGRRTLARGNGRSRAEAIAFPVDTAQLQPGRYVLHVVLDPQGGATIVERRVQFDVLQKD